MTLLLITKSNSLDALNTNTSKLLMEIFLEHSAKYPAMNFIELNILTFNIFSLNLILVFIIR